MKKILLISNHVFHYRQKVYNYFFDAFAKEGYEFHVLSNSYQNVKFDLRFYRHRKEFSVKGYIEEIKNIKPDQVILFLHLKDKIMLPLIYYCKLKRIPVIYWNHGINIMTPNAKIKNAIFHYVHDICDALITYTPEMKKYFKSKNQTKLFVAYNTLNFSDIDKSEVLPKGQVKAKYGIKEDKVILYISRLMPYKKVDLLLDSFAGIDGIAVVVVGPGILDEQLKKIEAEGNLYYLGEKYGEEVNEIYNMGDVFSTPGHIGLAMNEALFWGLPVIVLVGKHAPEIYYMKDGKTGFFAKDEKSFKKQVIELLNNPVELKRLRMECQKEYQAEVSIDRMYQGFIDAIRYCTGG